MDPASWNARTAAGGGKAGGYCFKLEQPAGRLDAWCRTAKDANKWVGFLTSDAKVPLALSSERLPQPEVCPAACAHCSPSRRSACWGACPGIGAGAPRTRFLISERCAPATWQVSEEPLPSSELPPHSAAFARRAELEAAHSAAEAAAEAVAEAEAAQVAQEASVVDKAGQWGLVPPEEGGVTAEQPSAAGVEPDKAKRTQRRAAVGQREGTGGDPPPPSQLPPPSPIAPAPIVKPSPRPKRARGAFMFGPANPEATVNPRALAAPSAGGTPSLFLSSFGASSTSTAATASAAHSYGPLAPFSVGPLRALPCDHSYTSVVYFSAFLTPLPPTAQINASRRRICCFCGDGDPLDDEAIAAAATASLATGALERRTVAASTTARPGSLTGRGTGRAGGGGGGRGTLRGGGAGGALAAAGRHLLASGGAAPAAATAFSAALATAAAKPPRRTWERGRLPDPPAKGVAKPPAPEGPTKWGFKPREIFIACPYGLVSDLSCWPCLALNAKSSHSEQQANVTVPR